MTAGSTANGKSLQESQKIFAKGKAGAPESLLTAYPGGKEDHMASDYENEEPTDEARTNEEAYEELQQQFGIAKYDSAKGASKLPGANCVFFNGATDEDQVSGDD